MKNPERTFKRVVPFLVAFVISSGCSTFESQSQTEWLDALHKYKQSCRNWQKELPSHEVRNTTEEKNMMEGDFLALRCKQDSYICTPPKKPEQLVYFETNWNKPFSPNSCLFKKDEL